MAAKRAPALFAVALVSVSSRNAFAYDAAVDATFDSQIYQATGPFGDALRRARYTETLSFRVIDLQGDHDPKSGSLSAVARLRLDADLGQDDAERDPQSTDRFIPGLAEEPLDVMMAYVEGRNYAHGLVGFRLGRQYVVDALGWWSFDGALVRLTTPVHLAVDAYGGSEQRGGLSMLGTSRFEGDGVMRGSRRGLEPDLFPAYLDESKLAPAYGFSMSTVGLDWLDARVTYRKVFDRDTVVVSPFADAQGNYQTTSGTRVSSERVGFAGTATAKDLGSLRGDFVYDAYLRKPTSYAASADVTAIHDVDFGVDADYFLPTFDGDSIFNWFAHGATSTLTGRARVRATHELSASGAFGVRRFAAPGAGPENDALGSLDGMYKSAATTLSLRLMNESGDRGKRRGADASYRRAFDHGVYDVSAILSLYDWQDPLRPTNATTSFTYVVGGGYRPFPKARLGVEWEHSMNEIVGQRFRALCTLAVTVL